MAQGIVKWFDEKKGYGFITPDDGGKDVFVHHSQIEMSGFKTLTQGDAVTYSTTDKKGKGPEAVGVKLANAGSNE